LILLVGALGRTLSAVAKYYFRFHFSHETARQAIAANLTTLDELASRLVDVVMLDWLAQHIQRRYPHSRRITLNQLTLTININT
jgi:hypothetical protein